MGLLLVAAIVGCGGDSGPPLAPVKGKLTLYGKPYPKAIITFEPKGGGPAATSTTDENGDYELWSAGRKGAVIGSHKVVVTTIIEAPPAAKSMSETSSDDPAYAAQVLGGPAAYKAVKEQKEPIPAKFNKNSELVHEVTSGANVINLDLK